MSNDSAVSLTQIKKIFSTAQAASFLKSGKLAQRYGALSLQARLRILMIGLAVSLVVLAVLTWLNSIEASSASAQTQIAGNVLMHSQRIGKAAPNAIQGNPAAFQQMKESRAALNQQLTLLAEGGHEQERSVPVPDADVARQLTEIRRSWQRSDQAAARILAVEKELTGFRATLQQLNSMTPRLLEYSEQIATLNAQSGASPREISAAGQLVMLTQRLGKSANEFLTSEGVNPETAFLLGNDTNTFRDIVEGFLQGSAVLRLPASTNPDARDKLAELKLAFVDYQKLVVGGFNRSLQQF